MKTTSLERKFLTESDLKEYLLELLQGIEQILKKAEVESFGLQEARDSFDLQNDLDPYLDIMEGFSTEMQSGLPEQIRMLFTEMVLLSYEMIRALRQKNQTSIEKLNGPAALRSALKEGKLLQFVDDFFVLAGAYDGDR